MFYYYFYFYFWCYVEYPQPQFPLKISKDSRRGLIRNFSSRGVWIACFCSLLSGSPRGNCPFMTSFPVSASICYFVISSKAQFSSRWSEGQEPALRRLSFGDLSRTELSAPCPRTQSGSFFPVVFCLEQVMCVWLLEQLQR